MSRLVTIAAFMMVSLVPDDRMSAQQRVPPVAVGSRVRVSAPSAGLVREVARVESLRRDSLLLRRDRDSGVVAVAAAVVQSLEVSRGQRRRIGTGIALGYVIMFALGFAGHPGVAHTDAGPVAEGIGYGIVYGTPVALLGGLLGASMRTERWNRVPLPLHSAASP
jgi:hypothetical protein